MPVVRDARQHPPEQRLDARPVLRGEQSPERAGAPRRPPVRRQRVQQALVQALPHLAVRISQPEQRPPPVPLLAHDGQVAGLEQQRLRRHGVHVEGRQQGAVGLEVLEVRGRDAAPEQRVYQEPRRGGLEPVRVELAAGEQMEDGVRVVDVLAAPPGIAVVPGADLLPLQARQLRREHRVEVRVGVAADRRVARVQGDVGEVVQAGEQAHLAEPAHPGDEGELDVGVAVLDRAVQPAQVVTVGSCGLRRVQRVQNRLVVLVHQHDHPPARPLAQRLDQTAEEHRRAAAARADAGPHADVLDLRRRNLLEDAGPLEVAAAEAQPHHRVALRPVPAVVDGQTAKQRLAAFVQLLERVHEQALAEPPRARQEVVGAGVLRDLSRVAGLVDIVVALLPDAAEGLDTERKLALLHGGHSTRRERTAGGRTPC